jgi:hypothetical protein
VKKVQLAYAVFGAFFMPFLAFTLLKLNNHRDWVGDGFRNGRIANFVLLFILLLFSYLGVTQAGEKIGQLLGIF